MISIAEVYILIESNTYFTIAGALKQAAGRAHLRAPTTGAVSLSVEEHVGKRN
jgi:hypothetical protein